MRPDRMLFGEACLHSVRMPLRKLGPLPAGWRQGKPNVNAAYFDFLMSRWLDSVDIASRPAAESGKDLPPAPQRLRARFRGNMVMLFGEATPMSGEYRVWIDGRAVKYRPPDAKKPSELFDPGRFARQIGGNGHHAQVIATGLDASADHILEIEPVLDAGQELRLEEHLRGRQGSGRCGGSSATIKMTEACSPKTPAYNEMHLRANSRLAREIRRDHSAGTCGSPCCGVLRLLTP